MKIEQLIVNHIDAAGSRTSVFVSAEKMARTCEGMIAPWLICSGCKSVYSDPAVATACAETH